MKGIIKDLRRLPDGTNIIKKRNHWEGSLTTEKEGDITINHPDFGTLIKGLVAIAEQENLL